MSRNRVISAMKKKTSSYDKFLENNYLEFCKLLNTYYVKSIYQEQGIDPPTLSYLHHKPNNGGRGDQLAPFY